MPSQAQLVNLIGMALERTSSSIETIQREFGFSKLGSGYYSTVFKHPFNDALVIKVGKDTNDAWLDYATYCMEYAHEDPAMMQVHDVRVFKGFYVAIMEHLEPAVDTGDNWQRRQELRNALEYFPGSRLAQCWEDVRGPNDFHSENVMMRGDQMVVTDPWSNSATYHRKYKTANGRIDVTIVKRQELPGNSYILDELARFEPQRLINNQLMDMARAMAVPMQMLRGNRPNLQQLPKIPQQPKLDAWPLDWMVEDAPKRVQPERAELVKDGSPASIWREKEDHMLRIRSQHDNPAQPQRLLGALFQGPKPRGFQAAWDAQLSRAKRAGECSAGAIVGTTGPPKGLYPVDPARQDAVALESWHRLFLGHKVWRWLQPKVQPGDPARL